MRMLNGKRNSAINSELFVPRRSQDFSVTYMRMKFFIFWRR